MCNSNCKFALARAHAYNCRLARARKLTSVSMDLSRGRLARGPNPETSKTYTRAETLKVHATAGSASAAAGSAGAAPGAAAGAAPGAAAKAQQQAQQAQQQQQAQQAQQQAQN